MSNDLPAMPPAPEEEPPQRVPESVPGSIKAQAPNEPAGQSGMTEPSGQPSIAAGSGQLGIESVGEVGARLAQLRTQRGMSLEDVSSRLKVAVVKLKALEGGDLSRLKDVTFALGVVRSYAKILGADPEPMVRVLRRAYGSNEQDLSMPASSGASLPRGKMSVNWRGAQPRRSGGWLWGVGVVVVAICLVLVFRDGREPASWFAHLKSKTPDSAASADAASAAVSATAASDAPWPASGVEGGPPPDSGNPASAVDTTQAEAVPVPASAVVPASVPARAVVAAKAAAASSVASAASASSSAAASAPAVAKAAIAASNAKAASSVAASAALGASAPLGASVVAQPGVPATLTFKVTEDSWISVREQDGREIFSGLVHPGDGQQIEGTRPLKVIVGNVHGIETMDIDGDEADLKKYMNSTGNVARFTLP